MNNQWEHQETDSNDIKIAIILFDYLIIWNIKSLRIAKFYSLKLFPILNSLMCSRLVLVPVQYYWILMLFQMKFSLTSTVHISTCTCVLIRKIQDKLQPLIYHSLFYDIVYNITIKSQRRYRILKSTLFCHQYSFFDSNSGQFHLI